MTTWTGPRGRGGGGPNRTPPTPRRGSGRARGGARKEIRLLGGEYESRRDDHLLRLGADEPPPRRLDLSRAELYELARRHGIEGRSAMSRRDLIAELQRRTGED